ncbi:hypothetical protein C8N25_10540 [Algoriphagus antarcticus]|uniref:Uncharacterized protein n=1 Tax=Algoriphagus antarcticus TaxID=238540 RepID=A0A3E0DY04_9BACT|nr:hypothetical protein C8N25_10540 [Algoriphagus antarcticus]
MVWTILILNLLFTLGGEVKGKSENETTYSIMAALGIIGDANLCMVNGFVIGTYSAGGTSEDVYEWKITNSQGQEILNRSGGEQYETIQFLFNEMGDYTISLKIRRGTNANFYQENLAVKIQSGPTLILKPDYLLCGDAPVLLYALDPASPSFSDFSIIWKDISGNVLGTENELLTNSAGYYFVELFITNPDSTQACTVIGTTFVGPPVDFQINKSAEKICEGNSIIFAPDTPISGEWFIQKSTAATRSSLGKAFEIELNSNELDGPGLYEVFFSVDYADYPNCASERKTSFELLAFQQVDTQVLVLPDDCDSENGSFQITSNSNLTSIEIPELGISESPVLAGEVFTYSNLKAKIYSIIATQNGCKVTKFVQLQAKNPPVSPIPTLTNYPETCSSDAVSKGKIEVDFGQPIVNGEYRLFSVTRGAITNSGTFPPSGSLELDLSSDNYLLELVIDGCTYPIESFNIAKQLQVQFSIPTNFQICESFDFIPETTDDLLFTLTYPDGSIQALGSGDAFVLNAGGNYLLKAEANDPLSPLCPQVKTFNVTLSKTISFKPTKVEAGCVAPIRYIPNIEGITPNETTIRWLNSAGEVVGRGLEFYPMSVGFYSLIVQPRASGFCDITPVEFEVVVPVTSVPMELEATKICPEPAKAIIILTTDEEEVLTTEWNFYDLNDQRIELSEFNNLTEVEVNQAGTYEAVAFNKFGCEIGRNLISVEESNSVTPDLNKSYPICSKKNSIPPIDPGEYEKYEWFFEEELIYTQRIYSPDQVGDYKLVVTTVDGCEFEETFITDDVCDYQVVYPNAMILGDPERNFGVVMNEDITEAELYISNRQGELIHHASIIDIPLEVPVLTWDGKAHGKYVPTGTYVVVIVLRNPLFGVEEKEIVSLLVLD